MAQPSESVPAPLAEPNRASAREEVHERADTVWTRVRSNRPVRAAGRRDLKGPRGRVAVVDGCRTPFVKAGTAFRDMDVLDLAATAAGELVTRSGIDPKEIDLAIFGSVLPA